MTKTSERKNVTCQKVFQCKRGNTDLRNNLSNSAMTSFYFHIKLATSCLLVKMQNENPLNEELKKRNSPNKAIRKLPTILKNTCFLLVL